MNQFSVKLSKIISSLRLKPVYIPRDASEILIYSSEVNRPGLQLAGFFEFFDNQRVQVLGKSEFAYLELASQETYVQRFHDFFAHRPVATIVARNLPIYPEMLAAAREFECPILASDEPTSEIVSALISTLNVELAPRITRHGVLVEVHGEGILLMGESGVGKSETAMELVKRGHRLIADDAVEIRRVSARTLVGTSPENIRHFMELRGIGIINVRRIFGIGSVKVTQQIDMIIMLEHWDQKKKYDRMGMENEYMEILGNQVTSLTIPVKPGRNLAIIIEVAAMNNRQKEMGYNSAHELLGRLGMMDDIPKAPGKYDDWGAND
ncbi:HPr(Ser) kinase/phosphatase [Ruminococcaceae bacterium OttesenSCG-928-L11]|nr:HPr(Ser) kinase/phosphatase [Ruminococcaceae bacterium OttesenSCG-928-L11]